MDIQVSSTMAVSSYLEATDITCLSMIFISFRLRMNSCTEVYWRDITRAHKKSENEYCVEKGFYLSILI